MEEHINVDVCEQKSEGMKYCEQMYRVSHVKVFST